MIEKKWRTLHGQTVDLRSELEREIDVYPDAEVHLGSDSQQVGQSTEYVTVCVVHRPSKGGRVFFCRERVPRIRDLRERLWNEVWRSTELAMELTTQPDIVNCRASQSIVVAAVHIDANVDPQHKSSRHVEELVGLVMGQGFRAIVKPEAWAASHAADHAVKHKNDGRKPHAEGNRRRRSA